MPDSDAYAEALRALDAMLNAPSAPEIDQLPAALRADAQFTALYTRLAAIRQFIGAQAAGDLSARLEQRGYLAGTLKTLQANLRHLTWQTQRIAEGDFSQRVDFMGEFSAAFNQMVARLEQFTGQLDQQRSELQIKNAALEEEIGQRRRFEQALRDSETRYRMLAHNATDVIWTMDFEGHFTYVSPSVEQLRGFSAEQVIGQSIEQAICPESLPLVQSRMQRALEAIAAGERLPVSPMEIEQPCIDGSTVWTEVMAQVMYDDHNRPLGILGVSRNINERKTLEAENVALYLSVHQRAEQLALLNAISAEVASALEMGEALRVLYDLLKQIAPVEAFYVALYDAASDTILFPAYADEGVFHSLPPEQTWQRGAQLKPGLTGHIIRTRETLYVPDLLDPAANLPVTPVTLSGQTSRAYLGVPLRLHGEITGVLSIQSYQPNIYSPEIIQLVETIATQVAFAIENARLFAATQQRAVEAETLREASAAVVATLNQDEAIERILEQLNRVVPYDSASVQLVDQDELEIVGGRGVADVTILPGLRFPLNEAIPANAVFKSCQPVIIADVQQEFHLYNDPLHVHIHGWMGVPLVVQDACIGIIALGSDKVNVFTPAHARLAVAFAGQVTIALENARLYGEVERLAVTDSLTGLTVRRHFTEMALLEIERACRYQRPLSVIMLDIDFFKRVNDTYGHLVGDRVLQGVAAICRDSLRRVDLLGRYGGEEFVILLPEAPLENGRSVAERLRQRVAAARFETKLGPVSVTASLGVSTYTFETCAAQVSLTELEKLIDRADQAMYRAKQTGRNRVEIYTPESVQPHLADK